MLPHQFWQKIHAPDTVAQAGPFHDFFPAILPDRRQILLPIRVLPGGTDRAVASLILNQASFAVLDTIADVVAEQVREYRPELIVAMPTLGLSLGEAVARRLGHERLVPLGTSRKFWYDENLSVPLSSITSPKGEKQLYADTRMLPLIAGRRILLVDDVLSSGTSMAAALTLLAKVDCRPVALAAAMLQGPNWRERLDRDAAWSGPVAAAFSTPLFTASEGGWLPM